MNEIEQRMLVTHSDSEVYIVADSTYSDEVIECGQKRKTVVKIDS